MRKLGLVALLTGACFLASASVANATSVNLRWSGGIASAGSLSGVGTSSITIAPSATATLTLDIRINVDSAGLSSAFLSLEFDRDLKNELNILAFEELSWVSGMMNLTQLNAGIDSTQESTGPGLGALQGQLYTFEATTLGNGPVNTTIAFGRVVFTTNHANASVDGPDVFSGVFNAGLDGVFNNPGSNIDATTVFGTASVNQVPEPTTLATLVLGLGTLALAGRRRKPQPS